MPDVIKNGRIIDYTENYKKRGYDTAVISAPIHLGDEDYYVAAVINVEKEKNSFYLHEVAILNKKEDDMSFKTGTVKHGTPSDISSSIYSLLNKLQNVNEGLKHPRKDNIADFARGNLLLDIIGNKYEADVVIGFTKYGMCELHDIVNMKPTTFEYKKEASYKDSSSKKGLSQKGNASFNNIISTKTEKSQEKFSKKLIPQTERKYFMIFT